MLSLNISSNFTLLDFSFEIEVTLRVDTKEDTSWPLKAELKIAEQAGNRLQMKYQNSGWQDLPNNVTISNIKHDGDEFKRDKIKIEFKSIAGKNFGKIDDAEPVPPIKIRFTTVWELDHANKPSNTGVGAVLENVGERIWKEAVINVQSGCKDVDNCECDVKLISLKMTSPNQNYIVGEVSKLNFDLVLENSGVESALNTTVRLMSSIINPTNNKDNKPKGEGVFDVKVYNDSATTEGNSEEKSFWEWKIAAIRKKDLTTARFKFQLNKVNFTGLESPLEKFNIAVDTWCKKTGAAVGSSDTFEEEADQALSFQYISKVKWEKVDTDDAKQTVSFGDDRKKEPFSQTFTITNKGPSPTVEKTQLEIFIPETKLVKSQNVQIEGVGNCIKKPSGTIQLSMNCKGGKEAISCQGTTNCAPYTCNLNSGWKKDKSYKINVPMSFSATNAEHSKYAVCVYAKVFGKYLEGIFSII